uniref:Rhoptry neck protein 2 n=1 Tax=Strongyloides stercoralis TaxID=6248 RepID=A0A913HJ90_STRER
MIVFEVFCQVLLFYNLFSICVSHSINNKITNFLENIISKNEELYRYKRQKMAKHKENSQNDVLKQQNYDYNNQGGGPMGHKNFGNSNGSHKNSHKNQPNNSMQNHDVTNYYDYAGGHGQMPPGKGPGNKMSSMSGSNGGGDMQYSNYQPQGGMPMNSKNMGGSMGDSMGGNMNGGGMGGNMGGNMMGNYGGNGMGPGSYGQYNGGAGGMGHGSSAGMGLLSNLGGSLMSNMMMGGGMMGGGMMGGGMMGGGLNQYGGGMNMANQGGMGGNGLQNNDFDDDHNGINNRQGGPNAGQPGNKDMDNRVPGATEGKGNMGPNGPQNNMNGQGGNGANPNSKWGTVRNKLGEVNNMGGGGNLGLGDNKIPEGPPNGGGGSMNPQGNGNMGPGANQKPGQRRRFLGIPFGRRNNIESGGSMDSGLSQRPQQGRRRWFPWGRGSKGIPSGQPGPGAPPNPGQGPGNRPWYRRFWGRGNGQMPNGPNAGPPNGQPNRRRWGLFRRGNGNEQYPDQRRRSRERGSMFSRRSKTPTVKKKGSATAGLFKKALGFFRFRG